MITVFIIVGILILFVLGLIEVYKRHSRVVSKIDFAAEYRNKFIELANKYFQDCDRYNRSGTLNNELYVWLTLNVSKIQSNVGTFGVMSYKPAFQNYIINNYQIIINTLPKFRDGQIQNFDVGSVDDCLIRYIGYLEEYKKETGKNVKNPIVWFREGFKEIISIPLFILSSFGIFSRRTVDSIMDSVIFKILAGLIALVTLVSGLVTIVVGYDQTVKFVIDLMGKQ
jgi:hypothetical protein